MRGNAPDSKGEEIMSEGSLSAMLIKQIHSELEKNANNLLRQDDITLSQISVLMELDKAEQNQMELKQLEHSLHVAQSTAAGIVHRLEQKRFVEALGNPEDRRVKLVRMTPRGKAVCEKAKINMERSENELTAALTDTEKEILVTLLQKVRDSFH